MNRFPWPFALCFVALLAGTMADAQEGPRKTAHGKAVPTRGALQNLSGEVAQVLALVSPTVVQIQVSGLGPSEEGGRTDAALVERQHSLGSGIIVDPSGFIMTNEHVIHGAQRVRTILPHLRSEAGVVVVARIQDSTSAETGLKSGDVIRSLNRTPIDTLDTLKKAIRSLKTGDAVALQVEHEGKLTYLSFEME